MSEQPAPPLATGWRRVLYVGLGLVFVGFGYLGVILPGVPATPFLMIASYFFVRSSPRLHRWLMRSPVFGPLLRDWERHRGIRRPIKIFAVCMVVTVVSCSVAFSHVPVWAKCGITALALVGITTILCVPTIRDEAAPGGADERVSTPPAPVP
jgi:uncharacterized membrane protein YbaN (DUF454 family)